MVEILLADDHPVLRRGVRSLLESHRDWVVCAEAIDGREAVTLATQLRPDVAILDLSMPELDGLEATRRICLSSPRTEVLVYTMHASGHIADEVRGAGAHGYVLKADPPTELTSAVEALAAHGTFWGSGAAAPPVALPAVKPGASRSASRRGSARSCSSWRKGRPTGASRASSESAPRRSRLTAATRCTSWGSSR